MPTIRDLSEYTGLAFGTVSKYLNGGNVRPENRAVLDEAVAKLNYRVNYAARALKSRRSYTIGVVLPASALAGTGAMLTALDRTLAGHGYSTILCAYAQNAPERDKLRLLSGNVDGIVILPNAICADEIRALCGELPVVVLDCVFPGAAYDSVLTDYMGTAYRAAEYLFARQHPRIGAILGAHNAYAAEELRTGFLRAHTDYQLNMDASLLVSCACDYAQGHQAFLQLCEKERPPTAVLAADAMLTMGAEAAASEKGMRLMQDIDIIGVDGANAHRIPGRRVPLFELPSETIGATTAQMLLERLNGGTDLAPRVRRIKAELRMPDLQTAQ
jgi:DNA-binding LacI/PurR family transcriptional regulator